MQQNLNLSDPETENIREILYDPDASIEEILNGEKPPYVGASVYGRYFILRLYDFFTGRYQT